VGVRIVGGQIPDESTVYVELKDDELTLQVELTPKAEPVPQS